MAFDSNHPDWRNVTAYHPILELDRPALAWELLRRNGRYRAEASRLAVRCDARHGLARIAATSGAGHWGLCFPRTG